MSARWLQPPVLWLVMLPVLAGAALYLAVAAYLAGAPGFPVDDAWIHQTLARSLAREGRLAVNPGEGTTASTSPLWTLILAGGYLTGTSPFWWSGLAGALLLGVCGWATARLLQRLFPTEATLAAAGALLVVFEWRLAWAAFSGMETLLFTALCLFLLLQATRPRLPDGLLGLTGGLATLARPEGVILFAMVFAVRCWAGAVPEKDGDAVTQAGQWHRLGLAAALALTVFIATIAPVLAYNLGAHGTLLPSTFQAKTAFYRQPITIPFVIGYLRGSLVFLVSGPLLVLGPGVVVLLMRLLRKPAPALTRVVALLPALWVLTLLLLYFVWLPVLYHHGRYLMPILPPVLLYGVVGTAKLVGARPWRHMARTVLTLTTVAAVISWTFGAWIFGSDVRIITDQQVAVAQWLRRETAPGTVVATHDIGAIGYFADRRVVDMAGLITPDLTATPRDRSRIMATLRREGAGAAAIFPSWYPWFSQEAAAREVFHAHSAYALPAGGEEMQVFLLNYEETPPR